MKISIKAICSAFLLCISVVTYAQVVPVQEIDSVLKEYKKKKGFEVTKLGKELKMIKFIMNNLSKQENLDAEQMEFIEVMSIFEDATAVKTMDCETASAEMRAEFFAKMYPLVKDLPVLHCVEPDYTPGRMLFFHGLAIDDNTYSEVIYFNEIQCTFAYIKGIMTADKLVKLIEIE